MMEPVEDDIVASAVMADRFDKDPCSMSCSEHILPSSSWSESTNASNRSRKNATRSTGEEDDELTLSSESQDSSSSSEKIRDGSSSSIHWQWRNTAMTIVQISNIFLWYYTNGMNGIAMESFANQFKEGNLSTQPQQGSSEAKWNDSSSFTLSLQVLTTTCFVTSRQLLVGAAIGRILLLVINPNISWTRIRLSHWSPLSMLHALGSLATNLGFMYGKASVIQVLKLLEPFETLLLSQFFFREGTFTVGIVSSMAMVVGGAMSLLRLQPTAPATQAVVAALASGLLLSCRNVLQRKHQTQQLQSEGLPAQNSASLQQQHFELTKLEKSVVQFTQLSFFSGFAIGMCYLPLQMWERQHPELGSVYDNSPDLQVFLWHPLYNIFSMITLGFCSALTHSLLNAGKRVFAICMAMLWFHEGLNDPAKVAGLFVVALGGCWYSAESKAAKAKK